ncbi:MAG: LD-carboxypeptidase [Bacteroidota bacterium]|nr:LD-carboxypeptidase [Bacteroidota bacterium]
MTTIPPYLKPGDMIGLVCPAGFMPAEKYQTCVETLIGWGFKVVIGKTPGHQFNYFSGTDEERLHDLQHMLDDKNIKAILCARGGYGIGRIIDQLHFKKFEKHTKWLIGFSDVTVLHSHLFSNYNIASLHAPMAAAFNDGEFKNKYVQSMHDALIGRKANYFAEGNSLNQKGTATGILVGGNLSLLVNMIGTPSDIKTKNKILFIEEVGEYIYAADRMMNQLERSGKLDHLKGLIIGGFSDMKDTAIPFGQTIEEAIKEIVKEYNFPVCFGFPVGHDKENYALKIGVKYKLNVTSTSAELKES